MFRVGLIRACEDSRAKEVGLCVRVASLIENRIAALVHPAVGAGERPRHALFIGLHLVPSLAALMAVPVRLAHGVPTPWEMAGVLLLQMPLLAAFALARGYSFRLAQGISAFGLLLFGCLLAVATPDFESIAYAVFVIALFEAAGLFDLRFGASTALGILAAIAVIPVLRDTLMLPVRGETNNSVILGLALFPVLVYAGALAWGTARADLVRRRRAAREESHHRALARAIGDLVLHIDRRGAVLSCSAEAGPLFALTPRDFSGHGFYERLHLADRPLFLQAISDAFEDLTTRAATLRLRTSTVRSTRGDFEEPVYSVIEMRTRRLDDADPANGGVRGTAVCLVRDVTQSRRRDEEIAEAQRQAERAEEARERFLANVSHELRTPLNAVIGFADLLAMEKVQKDPKKISEYASIISASGHHLLSVVNSILDMSKLEAGSFDIEPARFEPAALLDRCVDIVRLKAEEGKVCVVRDYDANLGAIVGDERACRQIVINLLSNAVKFTPKGGLVTLSARSDLGLEIRVEDTGMGIAATDLPRLGDAFFQASNARSRLFEGTGLGLSLVRGLVGLHGGSIHVASAPGRGTAVTVRLPRDCRDTGPTAAPISVSTAMRGHSAPSKARIEKVKNIA